MMQPYNFYPESITGRYTHIEVHAVEDVDGENFEQCDDRPHNADMWSIYGRTPDRGLECIADCPIEKEANELRILIECCMYGLTYAEWHREPQLYYLGTKYNQTIVFADKKQAAKNAAGYTSIEARSEREAIYLFNQSIPVYESYEHKAGARTGSR